MLEIISSFFIGVLAFFSPCIFPLIPSYVVLITGISADQIHSGRSEPKVVVYSVLFVLGFTISFVFFGTTIFYISSLFIYKNIFNLVAGMIIILFALHLLDIINIKYLNFEKRMKLDVNNQGKLTSLLIGSILALSWTPCITPMMAGVLTLANTKANILESIIILISFCLGLGVPFIIIGFFNFKILKYFRSKKNIVLYAKVISGILLLIVALVLMANSLINILQ